MARNIGDECAETVQCATTFEHSLCVEGRCRCLEGYHYEPDMARCFINRGTSPSAEGAGGGGLPPTLVFITPPSSPPARARARGIRRASFTPPRASRAPFSRRVNYRAFSPPALPRPSLRGYTGALRARAPITHAGRVRFRTDDAYLRYLRVI